MPNREEDRIELAEKFLGEAVFRSRGLQAARAHVGQLAKSGGSSLDAPSGPGNCGLGKEAAIDLELTERGDELLAELWPRALAATHVESIRQVMASWVALQDSLDRKRNHFIRDFRRGHGADRRAYSAEETAAYDAGIEDINGEVRAELRRTADELLNP